MNNLPQPPTDYTISRGSLNDTPLVQRWESLRVQSPQNSPFASPHYAAGMQQFAGYGNQLFLVSRDDKDLAGVLTYTKKKGPFRIATVPPFTSFSSLITASPLESVATSDGGTPYSLLLHQMRDYFDSILMHHHPQINDVRIFKWASWATSPLYTYHIDLTDIDRAEAAWSSSTRRTFKKHAASYSFRENPDAIRDVVALATGSYQRHGRALPLPPNTLISLVKHLQQNNMLRIFTVTPSDENRPTAALGLLHDGEVAYYWLAGSIPGHSMTVLLGHLLPQLASDGIRLFDFVGANTPYIAEFKRRFGPTLVPYFATTCSSNTTLAAIQSLKNTITSWSNPRKT